MSDSSDKFSHSRRRYHDEVAIARQLEIARSHGFTPTVEHKYAKRHALNCGNSNCVLCGNPRKMFGDKTVGELRAEQDVDTVRNRHGNGKLDHE